MATEICFMSLNDILEKMHEERSTPYYRKTKEFPRDYMSIFESVEKIEKWIKYQFEVNSAQFVSDVYNVCEKKFNKKYALQLYGSSGSGKTFTMQALADLYMCKGHIVNMNNTGERFSLQGILNSRILFLDEFQYHPQFVDNLKQCIGGALDTPVACKGTVDKNAPPTASLIMTNHKDEPIPDSYPLRSGIPDNENFDCRIIRYAVRPIPVDPSVEGKCLHPIGWVKFFEKYGHISVNCPVDYVIDNE